MKRFTFLKSSGIATTALTPCRAIPPSPRAQLALSAWVFLKWLSSMWREAFGANKTSGREPSGPAEKHRAGLLLAFLLLTGTQLSARSASTEISFRLLDGYLILVQGRIGSLEGRNFLVDTGANPSVIDHRIARELSLSGIPEKLPLLHGEASVLRTQLPVVQVGPVSAAGICGLIQDLSPIQRHVGVRVDAIIGLDVLGERNFTIDYEARKIAFPRPDVASSSFAAPASGAASLTVTVGNKPVRLLVDTGASDMVLFSCRSENRFQSAHFLAGRVSLNSEAAPFTAKEIILSRVALGSFDFGAQRALLLDDPRLCDLSFQGVVGPASLRLKQVTFDFDHQLVAWSR